MAKCDDIQVYDYNICQMYLNWLNKLELHKNRVCSVI